MPVLHLIAGPNGAGKLREAARMADLALLFDAADIDAGGPALVASVATGQIRWQQARLPRWAAGALRLPGS